MDHADDDPRVESSQTAGLSLPISAFAPVTPDLESFTPPVNPDTFVVQGFPTDKGAAEVGDGVVISTLIRAIATLATIPSYKARNIRGRVHDP